MSMGERFFLDLNLGSHSYLGLHWYFDKNTKGMANEPCAGVGTGINYLGLHVEIVNKDKGSISSFLVLK